MGKKERSWQISLIVAVVAIVVVVSWILPIGLKLQRPNILVVLVDTTRADRLGAYGSKLGLTPHLDQLAQEGMLFKNAFTTSPWTPAAVTSLFTGLYSRSHGLTVVSGVEQMKESGWEFPTCVPSLAAELARLGYVTGAAFTNPWVSTKHGFQNGFRVIKQLSRRDGTAPNVNDWATKFIQRTREREPNKPWFLYLHYMEPHSPYLPPSHFVKEFGCGAAGAGDSLQETNARNLRCYNAEVKYFDAEFGKLVQSLKEAGEYDNTLITVVSDHGEGFLEHGSVRHGKQLYNEELRVPLIMRIPGVKPRVVRSAVSIADIFPTLLESIGATIPEHVQGISFTQPAKLASRPGILAAMIRGSSLKYRQSAIIDASGTKLLGKKCIPHQTPLVCGEFQLLDATKPLDVKLIDPARQAVMAGLLQQEVAIAKNQLLSCAIDFQKFALADLERIQGNSIY